MTYAISDIHGCYDKYIKMLDKINFNDSDVLYVLGDVVDRGKDPIKVLQDMSMRANIFPIMGNHEYVSLVILKSLCVEITPYNYRTHIDSNLMSGISLWLNNGGQTTLNTFTKLMVGERENIIEYLSEFSLYERIKADGKEFILTHWGLPEGATPDDLDDYDPIDFVEAQLDYTRKYFDDIIIVTGHTPTFLIDEKSRGRIYRRNNHIAIDTGAVFGELMGCICLETGEEYYI